MIKQWTVALAFPTLLAGLTPAAFADPPTQSTPVWGPPGCHSEPCRSKMQQRRQMFEQLGLSPEQTRKIRGVVQQGREQGRILRERMRAKQKEMMTYIHSANAQEGPAHNINNEIIELQRQLSELRLKTWFAIRSHLTPEQRQKMSQLKPPPPPGMRTRQAPPAGTSAPTGNDTPAR